ncbi:MULTISPECIES: type II toxin-antitoxin system RelE/ParE family toxin [unclassified Streptomyces]|uniref:type II toxin-antitoxin system RelE family toxin n=1 Tax=unclassified Streptomyces TaxID=2593676 RepID=UPI00224E1611|nr:MULTISPECIES: type II toxin-antitoxin system RelE/ParE family toxin [unclassified Streptomyces]MCX4971373.1 type II toxin-antitoxin system RelE/ParE family toxin [Streptomyces sp. NBC_00620]
MKYAFEFTAAARRQLRTVDQTTALLILHALSRLGDDPYRDDADVKKLSGHDDLYRLRVGTYRIAYTIDDGKLIILVVEVGHRRDIYRRL